MVLESERKQIPVSKIQKTMKRRRRTKIPFCSLTAMLAFREGFFLSPPFFPRHFSFSTSSIDEEFNFGSGQKTSFFLLESKKEEEGVLPFVPPSSPLKILSFFLYRRGEKEEIEKFIETKRGEGRMKLVGPQNSLLFSLFL